MTAINNSKQEVLTHLEELELDPLCGLFNMLYDRIGTKEDLQADKQKWLEGIQTDFVIQLYETLEEMLHERANTN